MESVINLNNTAALLIENGRYKAAMMTLEVALCTLRSSMHGNGETVALISPSSHHSQTPKSDDFDYDRDFIYRSPMRAEDVDRDEIDELTLSVLVVFNMGLANQLRAVEGGKVRVQRLKKALKLYELSFCMQMKGDGQLNITQILALVNNCGQIYKQLNLQHKAKKFFQHMLSTIMTIVEVGEANNLDQIDGFLGTASQLILLDPAVAPAA